MAVTRLYLNADLRPEVEIQLDEERSRYIGRVLRLRVGDHLAVFNGDQGEYDAQLISIAKSTARILLGGSRACAAESPLRTHLVQAISRGERMDFVIQKATELGVKRISPVFSDHGVVRLDSARASRRCAHWQKIAESACGQSGRIRPPLIDLPLPLNTWFAERPKDTDTDLILKPGAATALTSIGKPRTKVCVMIGPEGGFSAKEYEDASVAGFTAVSLGPRILRTETAALATLAIVQSMWGDLGLD
jgi:16S rRNA (uracil1498-N3)-methyltransferase